MGGGRPPTLGQAGWHVGPRASPLTSPSPPRCPLDRRCAGLKEEEGDGGAAAPLEEDGAEGGGGGEQPAPEGGAAPMED